MSKEMSHNTEVISAYFRGEKPPMNAKVLNPMGIHIDKNSVTKKPVNYLNYTTAIQIRAAVIAQSV
jgi:hypothetical protein